MMVERFRRSCNVGDNPPHDSRCQPTLLYGFALEARFEAARRDGFRAVEILFPYDRSPEWYAGQLQRQ